MRNKRVICKISKSVIGILVCSFSIFLDLHAATSQEESSPLSQSLQLLSIENNQSNESNSDKIFSDENSATLKKAVKTAMESNYRIRQAQERIVQAEYSTKEAQADFLPQVDISASGTAKETKGFDTQNYSQRRGDAVVTYNLYSSGMHTENIERTKITKKEQEERLKGTYEEEITKAIDAYFSVAYGKLSVTVNRKNYEKLLKILEIVKIKRELGAATLGDESSIQASVSNAKTALINTESAYNNARDYYEFLTNSKIELLSPYETAFDIELSPFDTVFDEIKSRNTDLTILETQIKGKQKDVVINNATKGPKIDFSMTNSKRYKNDYIAPDALKNNSDFTGELTISYHFYDGGRTEAKSAKLLSEVSGLIYNLEYTKQDTKWNSQKLFNSVQTNSRTIETLTTEIDASRRMADAYWEKFRLSSQDLVTLLQAQRQVNSAELEKLRSEKMRLIDYFGLLAKQGKLTEYFNF